jgi:ketosteroid isomerase-like protein
MVTGQTDAASAMASLHQRLMRDFATGPSAIEALVEAYYAPDARVLPPNVPVAIGRAAIRDVLTGMLAGGGMELSMENAIRQTSGELAYHTGRYELTVRPTSGEPIRDQGKYLEVFRRQPDGRWQCVADMFSSDQAAS